jgi:hypothetical protein
MSICIAMSVCLYVWDIQIRDIMTSLLLSEGDPPNWGLYPELATMVDWRGTSAEKAQKGDSLGDSLPPTGTLLSLQR